VSTDARLILGDCLEEMAKLPAGTIDLIFTSPPYNLGWTSERGRQHPTYFSTNTKWENGWPMGGYAGSKQNHLGLNKKQWTGKRQNKFSDKNGFCDRKIGNAYDGHDDAMPYPEYVTWQKEVLMACWRLLSDTGAIFYNHKPRVQDGQLQTPLDLNPGLPVRQIIIWRRGGGINFAPTHFVPMHEWIVVFAKRNWRLKNKGVSGLGDVWEVAPDSGNPHPAPFPVGLPARAIEATAPRWVLDPFMGSGTTGVACAGAGVCGFIGIEKSTVYLEMAARRIEEEQRKPRLIITTTTNAIEATQLSMEMEEVGL
jgi:site-specific DNA-methyltransferase (adenine-specific)